MLFSSSPARAKKFDHESNRKGKNHRFSSTPRPRIGLTPNSLFFPQKKQEKISPRKKNPWVSGLEGKSKIDCWYWEGRRGHYSSFPLPLQRKTYKTLSITNFWPFFSGKSWYYKLFWIYFAKCFVFAYGKEVCVLTNLLKKRRERGARERKWLIPNSPKDCESILPKSEQR